MPTATTQNFDQYYASQSFSFGIDAGWDTVPGMKLESLTIKAVPEFTAEAKNLQGMTEAFVVGRAKYEFSASGRVTNRTFFNAGKTFDLDGKTFIITDRTESFSNTEFVKADITGVAFALISS